MAVDSVTRRSLLLALALLGKLHAVHVGNDVGTQPSQLHAVHKVTPSVPAGQGTQPAAGVADPLAEVTSLLKDQNIVNVLSEVLPNQAGKAAPGPAAQDPAQQKPAAAAAAAEATPFGGLDSLIAAGVLSEEAEKANKDKKDAADQRGGIVIKDITQLLHDAEEDEEFPKNKNEEKNDNKKKDDKKISKKEDSKKAVSKKEDKALKKEDKAKDSKKVVSKKEDKSLKKEDKAVKGKDEDATVKKGGMKKSNLKAWDADLAEGQGDASAEQDKKK